MNPEKLGIPSGENSPESTPASSIEAIRLRLQEMQALTAAKQRQWEGEKASIVKEIADMAEGNKSHDKALNENISKSSGPYFGKGQNEMLGKINNKNIETKKLLENVNKDYETAKHEIQTLRQELTKQQDLASPEEQSQYSQLLEELDQQNEALDLAHEKEVAEVERALNEQRDKYGSLKNSFTQFNREQNDAAKDPYKFATETVLGAHKEFRGKDYSGQKPEIEAGVRNEALVREYYKEAKNELPKIETYLASVEEAFDAFEKKLADLYEKAATGFRAIEDDLSKRVQPIVTAQSQIIEKGRNAGFFARLANAEHKGTHAEVELRSLKAEQSGKIQNILRDCGGPTAEIYYALAHSGGGGSKKNFSDGIFADKFPFYKLELWEKYADKNPTIFEKIGEKIKELKARGQAIGPRRNELLAAYEKNYGWINRTGRELLEKVQQMFGSI